MPRVSRRTRTPETPRGKSVKKIPPGMRKQLPSPSDTNGAIERLLYRLKNDPPFLRSVFQLCFALLCIWIGLEFHLFMKWGLSGGELPYVERPPGVGGFLPISSLMGLWYWMQTGLINNIHPSGLFIFVAITAIGLFLKKAFCNWLCPVGTFSESLWMLGQKIFGRNLTIPAWLDYPLRSLKYMILAFFLWAIFGMSLNTLESFLHSPYNRVADIKMYLFFADISNFSLVVISVLIAGSIVIKNFWCRYLCPYGAYLGALSWLSPLKITRHKSTCIDCELCTKACPANIKVHTVTRVFSDECMGCLSCVAACPVKDTLEMRVSVTGKKVPPAVFAVLIAGLFVGITGFAMLTGNWQNEISNDEYLRHFDRIHSPAYDH